MIAVIIMSVYSKVNFYHQIFIKYCLAVNTSTKDISLKVYVAEGVNLFALLVYPDKMIIVFDMRFKRILERGNFPALHRIYYFEVLFDRFPYAFPGIPVSKYVSIRLVTQHPQKPLKAFVAAVVYVHEMESIVLLCKLCRREFVP